MPVGKIGSVCLQVIGGAVSVKINITNINERNANSIYVLALFCRRILKSQIGESNIEPKTMSVIQILIIIYFFIRIDICPAIINRRISENNISRITDLICNIFVLNISGGNPLQIIQTYPA